MKIALSKNFHSLDKCFFYEILDSEMYEKLLRWLNIPLSEGEIFKIWDYEKKSVKIISSNEL